MTAFPAFLRTALITGLGAAIVPIPAAAANRSACSIQTVYVGTQEAAAAGGVHAVRLDAGTGLLSMPRIAAAQERPTWILRDPRRPVLYAVSEVGNDGVAQGSVTAYAIDGDGALRSLDTVPSGGGGATHLSLARDGRTLFVANYGTGHVAALPIAADGRLSPPVAVVQDTGSGPSPRQKGPHAHGVTPDPSGRYLLVPDLGADRVFVYRTAGNALTLASALALPPGTGPRHLTFGRDPGVAYLANELAGTLTVLRWAPRTGTLSPVQQVDNTAPGYAGQRSVSEIAVSPDGTTLYAANRGEDTIVAYPIDPRTGRLGEGRRTPAGGAAWSFAIDPTGRWLLAAHQRADTVTVFAIGRGGTLTPTGAPLSVPSPTSVAFGPSACTDQRAAAQNQSAGAP